MEATEKTGASELRPGIEGKKIKDNGFVAVCCSAPPIGPSSQTDDNSTDKNDLEYRVDQNPQLHLSFLFGLQQVLLSISSTISVPLIVSASICVGDQNLATSEIMSTFLFMCGVCTVLQCTIGVRLPIIQGGCHKFIPAIAVLMSLEQWRCPAPEQTESMVNDTQGTLLSSNQTENHDPGEVWKIRMREIQGSIMLASLTQVLIGCTGLLGVFLRFIGPMTIMPTIALVGLSLVDLSLSFCEKHWGIAALTIFLVILFSLYLQNVQVPLPTYSKVSSCHTKKYPIFKLLPVLFAVIISWSLCAVLTHVGVFSNNPKDPEYQSRTDAKQNVFDIAKWFFIPYPGQWGLPTVSPPGYVAMMAATFTSIIESVGDYYACARISDEPPPPTHAINRGIAIEGLGSVISGAVGSGGATTSYSQNIGAIGFTKVASRRAFQVAGIIFMMSGIIGKFGAVLTMMPPPVLGGIVVVGFGMVTSIGISNLQFVNLSSGRNMCIIGLSLMLGLMVPRFLEKNPQAINTGNIEGDQILIVLLSTPMFVGGFLGFLLDNTVPGTDDERGLLKWRAIKVGHGTKKDSAIQGEMKKSVYDLPYVTAFMHRHKIFRFFPFLPSFRINIGKKEENTHM